MEAGREKNGEKRRRTGEVAVLRFREKGGKEGGEGVMSEKSLSPWCSEEAREPLPFSAGQPPLAYC